MMSINAIGSSAGASSYYEVDDYYSNENADEHTELSSWQGKGAVLQGLDGPVSPEDFKRVLEGVTPDGSELGRVVLGERQHRPGLDLTFSPPKSVAILGQVFGDKRVIQAHNEAVKETLATVEALAAKTRVGHGGLTSVEDTKNLTIATFFHTATRAQDPGMHTHAVIANMTMGDDGKWRSLHNDSIWENSKARFGENYSMRLASKLNELGYDIVSKGKNAEYEVAGVPEKLIDEYSTRSKAIKELLDERGLAGPKNREWAALQTREKKVTLPKELETAAWKERADNLGINLDSLVKEAVSTEQIRTAEKSFNSALEGVKSAMEHLSQRNSHFTIQELVQETRNFVIGKSTDKDISQAITHLKENEILLHPDSDYSKKLTTREVVATENDNLLRIEHGKGVFAPTANQQEIKTIVGRTIER
jgi:conjugative relaxase-like TrwC/TraI family protein